MTAMGACQISASLDRFRLIQPRGCDTPERSVALVEQIPPLAVWTRGVEQHDPLHIDDEQVDVPITPRAVLLPELLEGLPALALQDLGGFVDEGLDLGRLL